MSKLYEQLQGYAIKEGETLDTMALVNLPANVRQVFQLLLRNRGAMTYPELCEAVGRMPGETRPDQAELNEILDVLCKIGWLIREEKRRSVSYQVRLGKTGGRASAAEADAKGKPRRKAKRSRTSKLWGAKRPDGNE